VCSSDLKEIYDFCVGEKLKKYSDFACKNDFEIPPFIYIFGATK
jgi:hypothetical protein